MKPSKKKFIYFVIGKRRVKILQSFNHSYLVKYYDNGKTASVSKSVVKKLIKEYTPKHSTQYKLGL